MEARVTRLETHFEYVRKDLDEIKGSLATMSARLSHMPTISNLWTMIGTVIAISLTLTGIIFTTVMWRQDQFIAISDRASQAQQQAPSPPPNIIINVPPALSPPQQ